MTWRAGLLGLLTLGVLIAASRYPAAYLGRADVPNLEVKHAPVGGLRGHFDDLVGARSPAFILHIVGGMLALATGPFQFWTKLRDRRPQIHRALGYAYFAGIAIGGAGGLMSAPTAWGGAPARWGFGLLAVTWMGASAIGLSLISKQRVDDHRRWMTLSYGLTCAALSLRLQTPLLSALGLSDEHAYQTVAWSCWIPQLVWWIRGPQGMAHVRLGG